MHSLEIYRQVAELHAAAIEQGFLSQLGPKFLTLLYQSIDRTPSSVLIVELEGGRLCGFVSGGIGLGPIYRRLLTRFPSLIAAMWPTVFSRHKLRKVIELVLHARRCPTSNEPDAELYSIAVSTEARGKGVAERLYKALCDVFAERGIREFKIVVGDALLPAQAFYQKMGARRIGATQIHGGSSSSVFIVSDLPLRISSGFK